MFPCVGLRLPLPEAWGIVLEGAGQPRAPVGLGSEGLRAAAALTSAGCRIHEGAVTLVMEEEVGPVLVVTEDIGGAAAEDGAHADTSAA